MKSKALGIGALAFGFSCFLLIATYFTVSYFKYEKQSEMKALDAEALNLKAQLDTIPDIPISLNDMNSLSAARRRSDIELRKSEIPLKQFQILNSIWINYRTEDFMRWAILALVGLNTLGYIYYSQVYIKDAE